MTQEVVYPFLPTEHSERGCGMRSDYKSRIRKFPCLVCGKSPTEAAHIRYSDASVGKVNPGIGAKPSDDWCVPLCSDCHRGRNGQHTRGERDWWIGKGIDPIKVALALKRVEADYELGSPIILHHYYNSLYK